MLLGDENSVHLHTAEASHSSFHVNLVSFDFCTGVILSLIVPTLYDKCQDQVDDKLCLAQKVLLTWYRKLDDAVLSKIPVSRNKKKKTQ